MLPFVSLARRRHLRPVKVVIEAVGRMPVEELGGALVPVSAFALRLVYIGSSVAYPENIRAVVTRAAVRLDPSIDRYMMQICSRRCLAPKIGSLVML